MLIFDLTMSQSEDQIRSPHNGLEWTKVSQTGLNGQK